MEKPEFPERPWIPLSGTYDVEAWIDSFNRELQREIGSAAALGCGICFTLSEGGEIFLHTEPEGDVLLDVTPDAEWVAPLLCAAARVQAPAGSVWRIPVHALTQLILGLSPLLASTRLVARHNYRPARTRGFY